MRALAYQLQKREFGGLPKWAMQSLAGSSFDPAETSDAPTPRPAQALLKPGARLVREWHGRTHSVIVLDDAFEFEGKRYASLTQIAREITGAHWSGPRFFGLVKRKAASGSNGEPSSHEVREESAGLEPPVHVGSAAGFCAKANPQAAMELVFWSTWKGNRRMVERQRRNERRGRQSGQDASAGARSGRVRPGDKNGIQNSY